MQSSGLQNSILSVVSPRFKTEPAKFEGGGQYKWAFWLQSQRHYTSGSQQDGSNATGFFTSCALPIAIETLVV